MKAWLVRSIYVVFAACCFAPAAMGQFKMGGLPVKRSTLIEQVLALKASNPKMTPAELAAAANELLEKNGVNFAMSLDAATCEKLRKVKEQQKDPAAPLRLGAALKSVDADRASLVLPEPSFTSAECGGCIIELPLLEVTEKDFVTRVLGQNIKFHMPQNFYVNEVVLVDEKDRSVVKRKWRVPFRSVPIGVSYDENVVYLPFTEPELSQLSLLVFGEGVFQIGTREEAEAGGKGKIGEAPRANPTSGSDQTIRFERWKNTYTLSFKPRCIN